MRRRFLLAVVTLGALSAMALAQSDQVVTLPLRPPVKAKPQPEAAATASPAPAAATKPAAPSKPVVESPEETDKETAIASTPVAVAPSVPLSAQDIIRIPTPRFTAAPLAPPMIVIDENMLPRIVEPAILQRIEEPARPAPPPPMPRPKPPTLDPGAPTAVAIPLEPSGRGVMQPIDDYRPRTRSKAAVEVSADAAMSPGPRFATAPMPQAKPAAPALQETEQARRLRRGVMEPIDDYRPKKPSSVIINPKALDAAFAPSETKAPQAMPAVPAPKPRVEKKSANSGETMLVDAATSAAPSEADSGKPPSFRCFVRNVTAFYDRAHVRCYNKAQGKLHFFAVDTSQPVSASMVAKGLLAMQTGKPVNITFAPGPDLNPPNCAPANCRRLIDIQN